MKDTSPETVIIGAGIHGISLALALASRGRRSLILDRARRPLRGASFRNEGKIHLGFVYALDDSGIATTAMVEGALTFSPLLDRWCGGIDWDANRSDRFRYAVMDGGLAGPERLEAHYLKVLTEIGRVRDSLGSNYLGTSLDGAGVKRHRGSVPTMSAGRSDCWFETPERAFDPRALCLNLERAVTAEALIEIRSGHHVTAVKRLEHGFRLEAQTASGAVSIDSMAIANCAWEDRPALDRMVLDERRSQNFRVKHHVIARGRNPEALSPITMVQGAYGDVVPWPAGDVYASWYPVSRTYFGDRLPEPIAKQPEVAGRSLEEIAKLIPALEEFRVSGHGACHILAEGETDITDPGSGLHTRPRASFVESGGWWSLRSGKLTSAPLAGERCAAAMTGTEPGL